MVGGSCFHLVNAGLALLRMLREYVAFQDAVPAFASDTARRVVAMLQARRAPSVLQMLNTGFGQPGGLSSSVQQLQDWCREQPARGCRAACQTDGGDRHALRRLLQTSAAA